MRDFLMGCLVIILVLNICLDAIQTSQIHVLEAKVEVIMDRDIAEGKLVLALLDQLTK